MTIGLGWRSPFIAWKNGRKPQTEKSPRFPFREILPLKLANKVSTKESRRNEAICLQEMAIMFACLKEADFKQSTCSKEIDSFQECYTTQMAKKQAAVNETKEGRENPYAKRLSNIQLNKLIAKYPQYNK